MDGLERILKTGLLQHNSYMSLTNVAMLSFSHSSLLKGDNVRDMKLANLFSFDFEDEGIVAAEIPTALVGLILKNKTNTGDRKDYSACLRNMDFRCCPIGWIALFAR
jgi:hypothetical protein